MSTSWLTTDSFTQESQVNTFEESRLYNRWRRKVKDGSPNDMVIVLTPSSKTGVSGSGKTTCGTSLAKSLDISDSGFDAETKATLDAGDLAYDILPDVEEGSAVIFDEAQGAPGTDSVNSRRGMKSEAIDAINAMLANRDQRITLIIIGQQLSMLDSMLYPLIDAWLLIRKEPSDPDGPLLTHHTLYVEDYDLKNPQVKTPALEDMPWPRLPADDEDYTVMERKKQLAKRRRSSDSSDETNAGGSVPKRTRDEKIKKMSEAGVGQDDIADIWDVTQPTVSRIINGKA